MNDDFWRAIRSLSDRLALLAARDEGLREDLRGAAAALLAALDAPGL